MSSTLAHHQGPNRTNGTHAPSARFTDLARAARSALAALALGAAAFLAGCSPGETDPATYTSEQKEIIAAASRAVRQNEDWADRAEYKLKSHPAGWQVTAWRVEHPEAKGNARYVPWGYRVIVVDRRGAVIEYKNSK